MTDESIPQPAGILPQATQTGVPEAAKPPADPFPCPNCGQMLGPGCAVCAACRAPVDFTKVRTATEPAPAFAPAPGSGAPEVANRQGPSPLGKDAPSPSQFSLPIFIISVLVYLTVVGAAARVLPITDFRYFLAGLLVACTGWVIFDAHARRIPHPLRWGLGTLFIWVVVFPWYLSRRRTPAMPCPIMDAQSRYFARTVVFVFVLCGILYCLVTFVMHKPPG